jgi:pimeloyl-ACP methyl ester carboxylesterase
MKIKVLDKQINYQIIHPDWLESCRPLLIFLHEGLGSIGQWKDFPEKLSAQMKLPALVYDRVGYGASDFWDGPISYDFLHREAMEYLPELLKALDLPNEYYLFGHSDGGTAALLHAATQAESLRGIIVEAPHVILEEQSLSGIRKARLMLRKPDLLERMNRYHNGRAGQLIDYWTSFWLRDDVRDWQMLDLLPKIECPVLLIQGDNDDFGTFRQLDLVAERVRSDYVRVEKRSACGHIPHLQQQDWVLEVSKEFLSKF